MQERRQPILASHRLVKGIVGLFYSATRTTQMLRFCFPKKRQTQTIRGIPSLLAVPEEALGKCGGSAKKLEDAIKCGRVIKGMAAKLEMFFFPRQQYAREKLVKQDLLGIGEKQTDDIQNLDLVAEADSDWDPSTLVAQGLTDIPLGGIALPGPSSSSQSLTPPPLTMPSPAGHYVD